MKIALLGTGFGQAHAAVYAARPDVDAVVVFGRTPGKLKKIADHFRFATTTDLDAVINDPSVHLVDICLPTALHADVAVRAMQAGKDVLIELPLARTMDDARRIIDVQQATGRRAFAGMFSRFSPANAHLRDAVTGRGHGPLVSLEVEGRTALLWEGLRAGAGLARAGHDARRLRPGHQRPRRTAHHRRRRCAGRTAGGRPPRCCSTIRARSPGGAPRR